MIQGGMKIRHLVLSLLPALAWADNATTVPDDEPPLPPLPEELLHPQTGKAGLPATAQPVVSYHAPADEEQTWLKLFYIRPSDSWPDIFRRLAEASHAKEMEMCHGYALWLRGQDIIHLRYDDDLSLSGIYADGHSYGVLYVEFSPYGIRVCPMEGFDLSGEKGGVCWQHAATRLWSWAEANAFWEELPRLLRTDKSLRSGSAKNAGVRRDVGAQGQRMVAFWATPGYPASAWWPALTRLHAQVGATRFSLVAPKGMKLWNDMEVPNIKVAAPAAPPASSVTATPAAGQTAAAGATASVRAQPAAVAQPAIPDVLHPASGSTRDVAPPASVRPRTTTAASAAPSGSTVPASTTPASSAPAAPAAVPAPPAPPASAEKPARTLKDVSVPGI